MSDQNSNRPASHRTFNFGSIIIDSDFDSGNCSHAEKINYGSYEIWIGTDNPKNNYRTWFYFSAAGFTASTCVSFKIKNMQNQSKLLHEGLVPVYRQDSSREWRRIKQKVNLNSIEYNQGWIQWVFRHTFTSTEKVFFAFFYPWSNQDNHNFLLKVQDRLQHLKDVYYYRSSIISTLQGRNLQFLAISSNTDKLSKEEKVEDKLLFSNTKKPLSFQQIKKGIVISARVHPGEVPGSHVMTGIIEQLTSNTERAKLLRNSFVFYIFPILNPDGVARGHYRVDTNGINLNRCYLNPDSKKQPTIYAIKNWILHLHNNNRFFAYLDLHAHASRRGTFIYGNSLNQLEKQVQTCLFPKILSLNSSDFEYQGSNFTEQNMYCKDRGDHMSKQGSGRVAMYKATKNPYCWTLQCNYNMSKVNNILENRRTEKAKVIKPTQNDLNMKLITTYRNPVQKDATEFFTLKTFYKLGSEICQSFLDLIEKNPESRIDNPDSYFQCVQNLKLNLAVALLRMAPNRFESHFRRIYNSLNSQNNEIARRSLQALYYILVKNAKITNVSSFIKDADLSTIIVESPKKTKSATLNQPKFSSLLDKKSVKKVKNDIQTEWKSQKNIERVQKVSTMEIIDHRAYNKKSMDFIFEFDMYQNEKQKEKESSGCDHIQNLLCEKLRLYQDQIKSYRTTTLKMQTSRIFQLNSVREQLSRQQRDLTPVKMTKLKFRESELPILGKKSSISSGQESPSKKPTRINFIKQPLLFVDPEQRRI